MTSDRSANFTLDPNLLGLVDNVALVTGGGGRGLGRAQCVQLARAGCHIVVAEINAETGRETVAEVEKLGRRALLVEANMSEAAGVARALKETYAAFGRLDVAVCHVGNHVTREGKVGITHFLDYTEDSWDYEVQYNLKPAFLGCHEAALTMVRHGTKGRIITISSTDGLVGAPYIAGYGAAKAAIIHMTKTLGMELAAFGIRVNCITPYGPWKAAPGPQPQRPASLQQFIEAATVAPPMGLADPMEVAGATVFLASRLSAYVTGHNLVVDGGVSGTTARPPLGMWAKPHILDGAER